MKIGRDFLDIFYDAIYGKIGLNLGIVEEKSIKKIPTVHPIFFSTWARFDFNKNWDCILQMETVV